MNTLTTNFFHFLGRILESPEQARAKHKSELRSRLPGLVNAKENALIKSRAMKKAGHLEASILYWQEYESIQRSIYLLWKEIEEIEDTPLGI